MADPVRIEGLRELDRKLAKLPTAVGFKALRSAMMGATLVTFKAAKANAIAAGKRGFDSGSTAAAMGRWTRKTGPKQTTLFIGPKNRNKKALALWNAANRKNRPVRRLTHFHLLEFGSTRGPAQPFLRPALVQTQAQVLREFGRRLAEQIEKAARSQ